MSPEVTEPLCVLIFKTIPSSSHEVDGPFESLIGALHTEDEARNLSEADEGAGIIWEVMPYTGPAPDMDAASIWVAVEAGADAETARMSPSPIAAFAERDLAQSWLRGATGAATVWEISIGRIDPSCPRWPILDLDPQDSAPPNTRP